MVRVKVVVEGHTEREFVSKVLPAMVGVPSAVFQPILLDKRPSLAKVVREVETAFDQTVTCVTTMIDFHGLNTSGQGLSARPSAQEVLDWLRACVDRPRFLPYVQMHEFEAQLFAGPDVTACELGMPDAQAALARIAAACGGPERIDLDQPPKRRLMALAPSYRETVHGAALAGAIGAERLSEQCPAFAAWLTRLREIASAGIQDLT